MIFFLFRWGVKWPPKISTNTGQSSLIIQFTLAYLWFNYFVFDQVISFFYDLVWEGIVSLLYNVFARFRYSIGLSVCCSWRVLCSCPPRSHLFPNKVCESFIVGVGVRLFRHSFKRNLDYIYSINLNMKKIIVKFV